MNKNVLVVSERFAPDLGGVATSASRVVNDFCEIGAKVHVFSWTKSLPPGQLETTDVKTRSGPTVLVHRLGLFGNLDFSLQYSFNIFEWLFEEHNFDLVWGHYLFPSGFVAVMIAERLGRKSIVSARGNDIDRLMFPPGDFARLQWTLERATRITAVSDDLSKKIDVIMGRSSSTVVLGNTVDIDTFRPTATKMPEVELEQQEFFSSTGPILGFCGELRQKKGLPVLFRTFQELHRTRGAKLLIIGAVRTRENNQLSDFLADNPDLAQHLFVTGHLDDPKDVNQFLNFCDIVLCPSLWDGVPNAILESMACERLVVASDAGGIGEIIENGINGFLVSKHSLAKFPDKVKEILDLPSEEKIQIQSKAREFCCSLWTKKTNLSIMRDLVVELSGD